MGLEIKWEDTLLNAKAAAAPEDALQITINRAALLRALGHIQGVVERRNTIPILGNVRIDATSDGVYFTATDMDVALVEKAEAQVTQEGSATAPAHMFYDIVRKLSDDVDITIDMDPAHSRMTLTAGRASFELACLPVEDFPVMEAGDFPVRFVISSAECVELLEKTRFAISTEETRYYLNGIYLHAINEGATSLLRAVATDGHRLARMEIAQPEGAADMPGIIIPRKTVGELKKILDESDREVLIDVSENKIRFNCGDVMLVSKLIDGTFPDYARVIPADNDKVLEIGAKQLREAVDRVSTIASDKSRAVKLGLSSGQLTLSADSQDHGTATEELEVDYAGDSVEIGFNSRYMMEVLSQIEGDVVQFVMSDGNAPALVRDTGNLGALYVIMPMRV